MRIGSTDFPFLTTSAREFVANVQHAIRSDTNLQPSAFVLDSTTTTIPCPLQRNAVLQSFRVNRDSCDPSGMKPCNLADNDVRGTGDVCSDSSCN